MKRRSLKSIALNISLVCAALLIGTVLGLLQVKPPRVNNNSDMHPAYLRMLDNIRDYAARPHPNGSDEIGRVRAAILSELEGMGASPVVEAEEMTELEYIDSIVRLDYGMPLEEWWALNGAALADAGINTPEENFTVPFEGHESITLHNILVKLDAPGTESAVMFVAHYDSTADGPGAADDMVSVCAMLEAVRAQAADTAPKSDLYFLFTDGEEDGLLGARKFVRAHPELRENVGLVVNLEARGNRGALLLFETSSESYGPVQLALRAGAKPIGTSFAAAVYAMMPNYTDLTAFLDDGYAGINFAAIEGVETYHMPSDSFENLDENTAWQYLTTVNAIAEFASQSPPDEMRYEQGKAVYFPFLPGVLVFIPLYLSHVLCGAACAAAVAAALYLIKRGKLKVSPLTVTMGILVLLSIGAAIFFPLGAYLFYIPLLAAALTAFMTVKSVLRACARMAAGVAVLLVWIPVLFLLWVSMIQPMML
ncbi:MAG: M20/M25/M40 family metallo-hydrolase [Oscillospiraceae bacterium]|jgi:hypothetical protein|nr:M20/M25/M40 family metallo-hydrolase [Oscillospiraceae bacterium]